jgi:hypothetical protein
MPAPVSAESQVYLNVPYDKGYEESFVALIAALIALGRTPRCVLEVTEVGQGRLHRIFELLEGCRVSLSDLSRVGLPARFNMPFELGLAHALRRHRSPHLVIVLEREPHRFFKTLSDLAGHDPLIHGGSPRRVIQAVLGALGSTDTDPGPNEVYGMWKLLWKVAKQLKVEHGASDIFNRAMFRKLVSAATQLAQRAGFIPP